MEIPKKFEIGTRKWRVIVDNGALPTGTYGMCHPVHATIRVETRATKLMTESFWHEVTHGILDDMKDPRWNDEKFVTAFSKRLAQVIHTAEF
jgi:hypothetical protein